jgi:hypothetical protein
MLLWLNCHAHWREMQKLKMRSCECAKYFIVFCGTVTEMSRLLIETLAIKMFKIGFGHGTDCF